MEIYMEIPQFFWRQFLMWTVPQPLPPTRATWDDLSAEAAGVFHHVFGQTHRPFFDLAKWGTICVVFRIETQPKSSKLMWRCWPRLWSNCLARGNHSQKRGAHWINLFWWIPILQVQNAYPAYPKTSIDLMLHLQKVVSFTDMTKCLGYIEDRLQNFTNLDG